MAKWIGSSVMILAILILISTHYALGGDSRMRNSGQVEEESLPEFPTMTRDHIIKNREARRDQLAKLLNEAKSSLEDHTSGRKLLDEEEATVLTRRVDAYERKLQNLSEELSEKELKKMIEREKMRASRFYGREL